MIIQPIKISGRISKLLSRREVFVCPKGFAAILYRDKFIYNINEKYEFYEDKYYFAPNECRLFEMNRDELRFKNQQSFLNTIFEKILPSKALDNNSFKILDFPTSSFLSKLAYLGIDNSIIAIHFLKESIRRNNFLKNVLTFRPRYKDALNEIDDDHISSSIDNFKTIDNFLLKIPFKYILKPMGKGKFLHINNQIDRSIINNDVLKIINTGSALPNWAKEVSEFKPQALSSLIFHSQIINDINKNKEEYDVLDYVFTETITKDKLQKKISNISIQNKDAFEDLLLNTEIFILAINNLTIDLIRQTSKWQNISFDQIYKLTSELPRKLKILKERISIDNPDYPKEILGLSVYVLSCSTENRNVISKIDILHRLGLRRIQDLVLFNTNCRAIFKDTNFVKKIKKLT
jgi:hypothetical protein